MLYRRLIKDAEQMTSQSLVDPPPAGVWPEMQREKRRQWLDMLGLDPLPERTPLQVTCTGIVERADFVIEKLHFQPVPGCRIAANLYRPKQVSQPLPAVLYVCGHSARGKFNYQDHPRWFARHGYVALIVDAIQIGENGGFHHGTYHKGWWHWYSQGYSPVAVEVWTAMRAADYLQQRQDVDGERLGITGNSGGGTVSWFTGAADPRFSVVVPSCQTGSAAQHIRERSIDGHCDCSFWINTRRWDMADLASLIFPRPLLIAAATEDGLFRPYAFGDVYQRARRLYHRHGIEDHVDLVDAVTPHGYSARTRLAIFSWFARHLQGASRPVTEDIDAQSESDDTLAVYPGKKPPADDQLGSIDRHFIPLPQVPALGPDLKWKHYRTRSLAALRNTTFAQTPETIACPAYECFPQGRSASHRYLGYEFDSEPGLPIRMTVVLPLEATGPVPVLVGAMHADQRTPFRGQGAGLSGRQPPHMGYATVEVRGTGGTAIGPGLEWTCRRAYPLLGQTLYERRILDFLTAITVLRCNPTISTVIAFGQAETAVIALYAALLDEGIAEVVLQDPPETHWQGGPELLNVLKVGDLPHNAALLAPRPLTMIGTAPPSFEWTRSAYAKAGAENACRSMESLHEWIVAVQ